MGPVLDWIRAAVTESHGAGIPVAVHATEHRAARAVVEAGADILAHSIDDRLVDAELIALMKARGTRYVTTFAVRHGYRAALGGAVQLSAIERRLGDPQVIASFAELSLIRRSLIPGWMRRLKPRPTDPVMVRNLRLMVAAGIPVAAGSDAGNIGTLHGPAIHRELALLVADGGLTPLQAITAATRDGAKVLGMAAERGTLEAGKVADFLILEADPLADIRHSARIRWVVKDGIARTPGQILREAGLRN